MSCALRIDALANPDILSWARRMAGFDVEDAAHKAQVKAERLFQWETGDLRPTIRQLRKLSDVYKRPLAVFYLATPPPDDPEPGDFRRLDPDSGGRSSPELRLAIRDAHARRDAAIELLDELGETQTLFSASAELHDDPEQVAARLRSALFVDDVPRQGDGREMLNALREAAEAAGILVFQATGIAVKEMRGFSVVDRPLPVVVLNGKDRSFRARSFTLLHEVAHLMLNRGGLCVLQESGPPSDVRRIEVFCNHVAGAALIPAIHLLQAPETPKRKASSIPDDVLRSLSSRYGASEEVVLRRLTILGRVDNAFYRRKREQFMQRYERLQTEGKKGGPVPPFRQAVNRHGKTFARLVLDAYDDEKITSSDVAAFLGLRLKHLDRVRDAVRRKPTDERWP